MTEQELIQAAASALDVAERMLAADSDPIALNASMHVMRAGIALDDVLIGAIKPATTDADPGVAAVVRRALEQLDRVPASSPHQPGVSIARSCCRSALALLITRAA